MLLYQPGYKKPKPPPGACKHKVQAPGGGFGFCILADKVTSVPRRWRLQHTKLLQLKNIFNLLLKQSIY